MSRKISFRVGGVSFLGLARLSRNLRALRLSHFDATSG